MKPVDEPSSRTPAEPDAVVPDLDTDALRHALHGHAIGSQIIVRDRVGSTMDELAATAAHGAPDGTVLIADEQTAGRGRGGRAWYSPPGTALLMSILFRPPLEPTRAHELLLAVALGALDAVGRRLPYNHIAALKWPNDLLVDGLKLGGVLAEACWTPGAQEGQVIVGLGLNVRQSANELPYGATSLTERGAPSVDRTTLAIDALAAADDYYGELRAGRTLVGRWAANLATLGQEVEAHGPAGTIRGRAIDVTHDGALIIHTADGQRITLRAGDVTIGGPQGPALALIGRDLHDH